MHIKNSRVWTRLAVTVMAIVAIVGSVGCPSSPLSGGWGGSPATNNSAATAASTTNPSDLTVAELPQTTAHLLDGMDNGVLLTDAELQGRNTWTLWTAGNERFWDYLSRHAYGQIDLLRTLSVPRDQRFRVTGLINEPGMKKAEKADAYGFSFDVWDGLPPTDQPDAKVYGRSSGVIGLRLFDNPDFDDKAKAHWDAQKYWNDPVYAADPDLVRPYTAGMSCGFCHVSFNPTKPPADPANPKYENLSSYIGAEFFWVSRIFNKDPRPESFVYQLMESNPPGSLDTSLISSDSINNPRTMNAIFQVGARLGVAKTVGAYEKELGATLLVPGVVSGVPGVQDGITGDGRLLTPHVLKDGADSVGLAGALSRVFINIGEYHEEWVKHFKPLIGGPETPMDVNSANENSPYWNATAQRLPNLAAFFLKVAKPLLLKDAPDGQAYLDPAPLVDKGKLVFADNCAFCHSSKQPPGAPTNPGWFDPGMQAWTQSTTYKAWMRAEVVKPDFASDNLFANDVRYSIKQIGTNACAAVASNAIRGHIWDSFSSETYKGLPPVGDIDVVDPIDGHHYKWTVPGGGRGYLRAPSLVSLWASAPFFVSNTLGTLEYQNDSSGRALLKDDAASVDTRMRVFNNAIKQLLWPSKREKDTYLDAGRIFRTSSESYLTLSVGTLPDFIKNSALALGKEEIKIGPFPKGTPINLLANLDMTAGESDSQVSQKELITAVADLGGKLLEANALHLSDADAIHQLEKVVPALLKASTCPDFEFNRGHLFGSALTDADKNALIAYLKTL